MVTLDDTLTIILADGVGSNLDPLTRDRAKAAVPFAGKYRIIDFTLSNCLHSDLRRILVLTQYKSHSLQKHLRDGWSIFNPELGEYVTPVPPQMRVGDRWYAGTADAIYQNLYMIERSGAQKVLILLGDHIYRMDYAALLEAHENSCADITVACRRVKIEDAGGCDVAHVDPSQRIVEITQRPAKPKSLADHPEFALVCMGVYVFSAKLLAQMLHDDHSDPDSSHDLGKDILPRLIATHHVAAYHFGGDTGRVTPDRYWCDVATLDAYYQANMDLLHAEPPIDLYQKNWPIRTYQAQAAPARTVPGSSGNEGIFINSIAGGGVVIAGGSVQQSVLFPQVYVADEAIVQESILFEGVQVGEGAHLRHCVVDKNVEIPAGEQIGFDLDFDRERFVVSPQGLVVIPKGFRFEQHSESA